MATSQKSIYLRTALIITAIVLISANSIGPVHAADSSTAIPSPNQQVKYGVSIYDVQCNEPLDLYIRDSITPVCIRESTYEILLDGGMNLAVPTILPLEDLINSITDATPQQIQQVVASTIQMYDSDPDNAFANINDISVLSVSHYPFVIDPETRTVTSHGFNPDRVGVDSAILGEFATNRPEEIIASLNTNSGIWTDYIFFNPATGQEELKRSWLVLHDGYIFGAGFYYSIEEKMKEGIRNSMDLIDSEGEGAFELITNAMDRGKYATVFDPVENIELANARQPHRVGGPLPIIPIPWIDFAEILRSTDEHIWSYTLIINPVTGEPAQAAGIFEEYGRYILVNGYTYPAEDKIRHIVEQNIALYEADKENAFQTITSDSLDPHYPFVIDADTRRVAANGAFPHVVGNPSTIFFGDNTNKSSEEIFEELQNNDGTFVTYRFPYPGSSYEETKRSWLVLHDGYIFGSGYYQSPFIAHPAVFKAVESSTALSDADSSTHTGDVGTQNAVDDILNMYNADAENVFASTDLLESTIEYDPFILDQATGAILAHWTLPDSVGAKSQVLGNFAITPPALVLNRLNGGVGTWAEHISVDPTTGKDQLNRSWLVFRDGYIFGASASYDVRDHVSNTIDTVVDLYKNNGGIAAFADIASMHDAPASYHPDFDDPTIIIDPFAPQSDLFPLIIDPYTDPANGKIVSHDGSEGDAIMPAPIQVQGGYAALADTMIQEDQSVWLYALRTDPITGLDEQKAYMGRIHDGYIFGAGYEYSATEKAQYTVQSTISMYESDSAATITNINTPSSIFDPHYAFILNADTGEIVAHGASPQDVGSISAVFDGTYSDALAGLQQDGDQVWIEHSDTVPGTDSEDDAAKRSFLQLHDGLVFGSGYLYATFPVMIPAEPADDDLVTAGSLANTVNSITDAGDSEVQDVVNAVIRMYGSNEGELFSAINTLAENAVPHYPFVLDTNTGMIVAHGAFPDRIGVSSSVILGDLAATPPQLVLERLQNEPGIWLEYTFIDPTTGENQLKRSWLTQQDNYLFGAGYYYPVQTQIEDVIDATINLYDKGKTVAFARINALYGAGNSQADTTDPSARQADISPLIIDPYIDPVNGRIVTHSAGTDISVVEAPFGIQGGYAALADTMIQEDQNVLLYDLSTDSDTGLDGQNIYLGKMHDGYIFGAQYGYSAAEKVEYTVLSTIALYNSDKVPAIAGINTPSKIFDPHYVFILDVNTGEIVAHGASPQDVGSISAIFDGTYSDALAGLQQDGDQVWIEHSDTVPGTDSEDDAAKRSFLQLHDGLVFGSGYLYATFPVMIPAEPANDDDLVTAESLTNTVDSFTHISDAEAQKVVAESVRMYGSNPDEVLATINALSDNGASQHNPFVLDLQGVVVADGTSQETVGSASIIFDEDRDSVLADLQNGMGVWVDYIDAVSGTEVNKRTYLYPYDGYIFGSSYVILDETVSPSEYTPSRIWADFRVVALPEIAFEGRNHEFDMVNGNALHGVFIPHIGSWIRQDVSPAFNDPSLLFRYVTLLLNSAFDAVAPYHETAVGVNSRMDHRPASESLTNENPNTAAMYAVYRTMLEFAPDRTDQWRSMMTVHGFDPDNQSGLELDCAEPQSVSSPAIMGNFAAKCVLDAHRHDGYNQYGFETDGVAFGDTTGYVPVNTYDTVNDPSRWQPLAIPNPDGGFTVQKFVTPQYANVEPYSDFDPRSIRVPPPTASDHLNAEAYKAQADEVIAITYDITDKQKMTTEFFDNKLRGTLFRPVLSNLHNTVDFIQWDFLINMAAYDTGIVIWQEKARYDTVRPITAIPYLYGDELIKARGLAGHHSVEIPANEWTTYVGTADHQEYPSGTAAFCATDASVWRLYSGTDQIGQYINQEGEIVGGYEGVRPAGSSIHERGLTPATDLTIGFESWSEYAQTCGESRVWGGVHFLPSIAVVEEVGDAVGLAAFKYWESLMLGEEPLRGEFRPLEPDPLLSGPFWIGR